MKQSYVAKRVPIILVTGFLGAGKTSLLRAVLGHPELTKTALVINEIGELGLDQDLIQESGSSEAVLLAGGCVCCVMKNDLSYTLRDLSLRVERNEIAPFRRVVVETTGLANPAPILHSILGDPWIRSRFQVTNVITMVDLVNGLETLAQHAEAIDQVVYADTLLMSKRDLVEEKQELEMKSVLSRLNPHVVPATRDGPVDPQLFLSRPRTARLVIAPSSFHGDVGHISNVSSASVNLRECPTWKHLAGVLDRLSLRFSGHLLRVKGILAIADIPQPVVIHGVQRLFHPPELLDEWPSGRLDSRLVFISKGLPADQIASEFESQLSIQRLH